MTNHLKLKQKALGNRIREFDGSSATTSNQGRYSPAAVALMKDLLEQIESGRAKITVSMIASIAAALETQVATVLENII